LAGFALNHVDVVGGTGRSRTGSGRSDFGRHKKFWFRLIRVYL
jgi:hypothetical protein